MPFIVNLLRSGRPVNGIIAGLGVFVGYFCLFAPPPWQKFLPGAFSLMLIAMGGNIQNDVIDTDADKISHPDRPIAAGKLNAAAAARAAYGFYTCGLALSLIVSPAHGLLAALMIFLLLIYNYFMQAVPLAGNAFVSVLCGLSLYYPEWPQPIHHTFVPFIFAFLTTMAREITKDIQDEEGDRISGLKTLAVRAGKGTSRKIAAVFLILILLILPFPMLFFNYHFSFSIIAAAFVVVPIILTLRLLFSSPPAWEKAQKMIKILILGGMAAILAGNIFVAPAACGSY